jgi:Diguanylate cyclase, GGDEF domain
VASRRHRGHGRAGLAGHLAAAGPQPRAPGPGLLPVRGRGRRRAAWGSSPCADRLAGRGQAPLLPGGAVRARLPGRGGPIAAAGLRDLRVAPGRRLLRAAAGQRRGHRVDPGQPPRPARRRGPPAHPGVGHPGRAGAGQPAQPGPRRAPGGHRRPHRAAQQPGRPGHHQAHGGPGVAQRLAAVGGPARPGPLQAEIAQPVTASLGIAAIPDDAGDADTLIRAADRPLYAAKANGRNRPELFISPARSARTPA